MTDRPSDADTARVVADQYGEPHPHLHYRYCNKTDTGWFFDPSSMDSDEYADPRDDPDAALELLRHIQTLIKDTGDVDYNDEGQIVVWWGIKGEGGFGYTQFSWTLPPSGPGFRYGIVWIAAEVMGCGEAQQRKPGGPPNGPPS